MVGAAGLQRVEQLAARLDLAGQRIQLVADVGLADIDKAGARHPRLQLRQLLQPRQQRRLGIVEMAFKCGRCQHRQDERRQGALVLDADDVFLHEHQPFELFVGRGAFEVGRHRFLCHQPLGAQGEGGDQVLMAHVFADAQHDAVGDLAQRLQLIHQRGGAEPAVGLEFRDDAVGDSGTRLGQFVRAEAGGQRRQALRRAAGGLAQIHLDQAGKRLGQRLARPDQLAQRRRAGQDFRDHRVNRREQQLARLFLGRGVLHQRDQAIDFLVPVVGALKIARHRAVEDVSAVGRLRQLHRQRRELLRLGFGKQAGALVAIDFLDRLLGQLIQTLDDHLHRLAGGGGLGHRHFLHGVLEQRAGGFQLFQQVGAVQQFGHRHLAAGQEVGQQPADGGAGVIGIKIVGLEAGQGVRRVLALGIDLHLVVAVLENLQAEIVAGFVVVGFLDDLDAGGLFGGHHLLRHLDGAVARR